MTPQKIKVFRYVPRFPMPRLTISKALPPMVRHGGPAGRLRGARNRMTLNLTPAVRPTGGHFFTAQRLSAYPLVFLTVYILVSIAWLTQVTDLVDPRRSPIGYDFITFWGGSWLAWNGSPQDLFDAEKLFAAQRVAVPGSERIFLWHYPPTFLLIAAPLSLLPYIWSYLLWTVGTFAGYAWIIRKMAPQPQAMLLLLAFPGAFMNFFHGQNAFLTATLFGGAMLTLERRPAVAGILLGLMSYKPHFGVLVPLALIFGRHWTTLAAAAATTATFAGASVLILGYETWVAFWNNAPLARAVFEDGLVRWEKIPSLFAGLRLTGMHLNGAYILQGVLAAGVIASVACIWRRGAPLPLRAATLITGSLLVTPYLFDYDLALLAIPIALLAMDGCLRGWRPGERTVLAVAWIMPLATTGIADWSGLPIGPACILALFAVAVQRALAAPTQPAKA